MDGSGEAESQDRSTECRWESKEATMLNVNAFKMLPVPLGSQPCIICLASEASELPVLQRWVGISGGNSGQVTLRLPVLAEGHCQLRGIVWFSWAQPLLVCAWDGHPGMIWDRVLIILKHSKWAKATVSILWGLDALSWGLDNPQDHKPPPLTISLWKPWMTKCPLLSTNK